MEELGQGRAAEEIYRQYAADSGKPADTLVLAQYLGRQGHTEEALKLCEAAWRTCPAEAVGYASLAVLRSPAVRSEQRARVKARLEAAVRDNPRSNGLLICLADLADLEGDFAAAEGLYRQVLGRDPRNVEALNNLAWQLAFREGGQEEALRLADQAVEILGPRPEVLDTRALASLACGQTDKAITDLLDAIRPSTDRKTLAAIQFHLAQAYQTAGKADEAKEAFQRARAAGLGESDLHPRERSRWEKLAATTG
jgi:tetratricopeptide (TPR) repeat protein